MTQLAIRVEGLGKEYRIGGKQERYKSFRESVTAAVSGPLRGLRGTNSRKKSDERFWALKDISFEVKRGDVLGVIGRNGAGKSTLLKILSRITEPTTGYAEIYGRVGSLLEVGTGFHPELTGRENIFLNGAILGMGRQEIERKFDEIVAFAEVEKFIDTAVKHFSSGMYLRLAFAVAAHLETEILLVDEVLAVGDAEFQKKCLGKMGEVAQQGRTVIFVSHNMTAIAHLCNSTLLLEHGKIRAIAPTDEAINLYLQDASNKTLADLPDREDRTGNGIARFSRILLYDENRSPATMLQSGGMFYFALDYTSTNGQPLKNVDMEIKFCDLYGYRLFTASTFLSGSSFLSLPAQGTVFCEIQSLPMAPGNYSLILDLLIDLEIADELSDAAQITVVGGDFFQSGKIARTKLHGPLLVANQWYKGIVEHI